jgi:hypothetical protein
VVVAGGVVSGTWELDDDRLRVAWFPEAGRMPRTALLDEVARMGDRLARGLEPILEVIAPAGS